jgi:hypothetical protein
MSDLRKMARDAGFNVEFDDYVIDHWKRFEKLAELIKDAALAQSEPTTPVGWFESPHGAFRANPLYKLEFPSQLLAWSVPVYTAPPQRKPLTEEEIAKIDWKDGETLHDFARAIEREHRIL